MADERFLVTGASGCAGAWVVRNLIRQGVPTAAFMHSGGMQRLGLIMSPQEIEKIQFILGDVADPASVHKAFEESRATNVIHLAALLLPLCRANPTQGAMVNVVGTVNVFEAAKRAGLKRVVYASTTAVYGTADEYPAGKIPHDAPLKPRTHYGVYKVATEGLGKVYWLESGISSIGLRPHTIYGAGRDQGITSTPTKAMLAAAAGRPYRISFGGRYSFQYADDIAKQFIAATRVPFEGADVFANGGAAVSTEEIVACILREEPAMASLLTYDDTPMPFPPEFDNSALVQVLGPLPYTPLEQGVRETIRTFKQAISDGRITPEALETQLR